MGQLLGFIGLQASSSHVYTCGSLHLKKDFFTDQKLGICRSVFTPIAAALHQDKLMIMRPFMCLDDHVCNMGTHHRYSGRLTIWLSGQLSLNISVYMHICRELLHLLLCPCLCRVPARLPESCQR